MGPDRYAADLTLLLNHALPTDERFPVDVGKLLLEISRQRYPGDPVLTVAGDDIPGFEGGLFPIGKPRRGWAVAYSTAIRSEGRRRFTLAHEAGHYFLHRPLLPPDGIRCGQAAVVRGEGATIEKEADRFAACLLMPLDDFRKQLSPRDKPDLQRLSACAQRYGVSLIAVILRWLEYTERRAMIVVSRDGYARWARSSEAAYKSGRFIRTSGEPFEIPSGAVAANEPPFEMDSQAVEHAAGIWFDEPVEETSIFSEVYEESTLSLLHFGTREAPWDRLSCPRPG
ncbi:ImmA/IrrE family metallo-endopeptidase [Bosea sp. TAF32]|uniref:ImmA/IrrE family metallo-endopeptidase n=1 Tax=Bosea sp. TAF32 TaxID=3237482 RepID=UPI003F918A39